ncbi:MAG: hypothetical protein FWD26_04145 [Treponema sp.]|nr:hypothetical protein [Treponema sp.]
MKLFKIVVFALVASLLFVACQDPYDLISDDDARNTAGTTWNFQASASNLVNYSTGNENTRDIAYTNNMHLLGSQRSFRWMPSQSQSGTSNGCIQTGGATASGKYFLEIRNIPGPMRVTLVFTDTGSANSGRRIELYNGTTRVHQTSTTNGMTVLTSNYDKTASGSWTLRLGCTGGIRLYEVRLTAISSSGSSSSGSGSTTTVTPPSSGGSTSSGTGTNSTATTIFNNLKGKQVRTGGWADQRGVSYTNPSSVTFIGGTSNTAKRTAFTNAINNSSATFIVLSGDVDLSDGRLVGVSGHRAGVTDTNVTSGTGNRRFEVQSNTTIIGIDNARIMYGGLRINGRQNVIIKNVTFFDARDTRSSPGLDALNVDGGSSGIWIDHCTFTTGSANVRNGGDWHDTLFNVQNAQVTVSNSRFTNANETMLFGGSDSATGTSERRVTIHHTRVHSVRDRVPRTRGCEVHLYSNLYQDIWGYVLGPGVNSRYIVENCVFESVNNNRIVNTGFSGYDSSRIFSAGNTGNGTSSGRVSTRSVDNNRPFTPPYSFSMTATSSVKSNVNSRAGATLGSSAGNFNNMLR